MAWTAPIGIPTPDWGATIGNPIDYVCTLRPSPWTSEIAGCYYVDYATGTDSGRTYGYPGWPRQTVPTTLAAGSYVELAGAVNYNQTRDILCNGTSAAPVWIRANSYSSKAVIRREWTLRGSYAIVENLETSEDGTTPGVILVYDGASVASDHFCIRNCDIHGFPETSTRNAGIAVSNYNAHGCNYCVFYNLEVHDNGDWDYVGEEDQDVHGIYVARYCHHIWIVDCTMYHNSGDGMQINPTVGSAINDTNHVYVGRCTSHDNYQTGFWVKYAEDVIFSECTAYNHTLSAVSSGAGFGCQYDNSYIWWVNCRIYDCGRGIHPASNSDMPGAHYMFVIGNRIHNIHAATDSYGYGGWGGTNRNSYVINNTFYDCDNGIDTTNEAYVYVENNIFSTIDAAGFHVSVVGGNLASNTVKNNVVYQPAGSGRFFWGSTTYTTLAGFQSGTGKGESCTESDPLLVAPGSDDFRIGVSSPAKDTGLVATVYQTFYDRYGLSIAKDWLGTSRPYNGTWDMGAHEYEPGTGALKLIGIKVA